MKIRNTKINKIAELLDETDTTYIVLLESGSKSKWVKYNCEFIYNNEDKENDKVECQSIELIEINGKQIEKIEYKGHAVISLRMIDELHERPNDTAIRNFNQNKEYLIENVDYFKVPYKEWSCMTAVRISSGGYDTGQRNPMTFLTQTGYLMLVKSFHDTLAWQVQRQLVNSYFIVKEALKQDAFINDGIRDKPNPDFNFMVRQLKSINMVRNILNNDELGFLKKQVFGDLLICKPRCQTKKDIVLSFMKTTKEPLPIDKIAQETNIDYAYCKAVLQRFLAQGVLIKPYRGYYQLNDKLMN